MMPMSRRSFLQLTGAVVAGAVLEGLPAWARTPPAYPILIGGEDVGFGHRLRDRHPFTLPPPSQQKDVVIIGGGVSGLRAAHALRDLDLLVLEREPAIGGHARSGEWRGIRYAEGTAYVAEVDDRTKSLFQTIGFAPRAIPDPTDVLLDRGHFVPDFLAEGRRHLSFSANAKAGMARFQRDLQGLASLPDLPFEDLGPDHRRLDRQPFLDYVKPYGRELVGLLDLYCRSALGGGIGEVSTLAGIYFCISEFDTRYTLPGGLASLASCLATSVDKAGTGRVRERTAVVRVRPQGDSVLVTYLQGEETVTVSAKAVIMACNKQVAKHLIDGMPPAQHAAMAALDYEPFLVTNILLDGVPYRRGYDLWLPGAPFTDVVVADWVEGAVRRPHSVLTIYHPLRRQDRALLLVDDVIRDMVRADVAYLDRHIPGLRRHVREVRCFRRGHALVRPAVGAVHRHLPLLNQPVGNVFFGHSDSQLVACVESALFAGERAAGQVRQVLAQRKAAVAV